MDPFSLTWLTSIIFVLVAFWGSNVPTLRRSVIVVWIAGFFIIANLVAQSYIFRGNEAALTPGNIADARKLEQVQKFLNDMALVPGTLHINEPSAWYKIISSSILHFSWIHLLTNLWFFILFGHVIEQMWGRWKLLLLVAVGFIIPPALDGFIGTIETPTGSISGIVYVVMGAYLVSFPRSRYYGAVNYDLRFWGAVLFIMLPVTMVTRYAGMTLTEPVLLAGVLGFFLLIQPEHARISVAAGTAVLYKLFLDWILIQPAVNDVAGYSFYRTVGALAIGAAIGLAMTRGRGWKLSWEDETRALPKSSRGTGRMSLAQLEAAAQNDEDAARAFLGQRVFVGDSIRAITFYREVVIKKYPILVLPLQEQMALARLLHFKGHDVESLHAYETLLKSYSNLPDEYWLAWLKAAELVVKLAPARHSDARFYLDQFEQGIGILMRDRIEAENLRATLPARLSASSAATAPIAVVDVWQNAPQNPLENQHYSHTAAGKGEAFGLKSSRKRRAADEPTLDFPKSQPRTFKYLDSDASETLSLPEIDINKQAKQEEPITAHWKPLPCISKDKISDKAPLDFRIKNSYLAEDDQKPGGYGIAFREPEGRGGKKSSRLSKLELMSTEIKRQVPEKQDMPTRYGGLDDHKKGELPDRIKFRLRGEKDHERPQ